MLLNDIEITRRARKENMIKPFTNRSINTNDKGEKIPSYGLSSFGYDLTLGNKIEVFIPVAGETIDTKNPKFTTKEITSDESFIIPPLGFALGFANEYIKKPRDLTAMLCNKSSLIRCGLNVSHTTVAEAGWEGQLTLEIKNMTHSQIRIYPNTGICQLLFFKGRECAVSYADRNGKYQNQESITLAKV